MRFLLYPEAVIKTAPQLRSTLSSSLTLPNQITKCVMPKNSTGNGRVPTLITSDDASHTILKPELLDKSEVEIKKKKAWGQQCSSTCGCVVRFEAVLNDDDKGTLNYVSYHAQKLVAIPTQEPRNDRSKRQLLLTTKGRPMFQESSCRTLHHLSSATIQYMMKLGSIEKFKSTVEFQHIRSSPAFCRSVLEAQNLPNTDTHCVDVIEEAVTALCKGYLPFPRKSGSILPSTQCYGTPVPLSGDKSSSEKNSLLRFVNEDADSETDDEYYRFSNFARSWSNDIMSTKRHARRNVETWLFAWLDALGILPVFPRETKRVEPLLVPQKLASPERAGRFPDIHDWLTYVDEIQQLAKSEEDQNKAAG